MGEPTRSPAVERAVVAASLDGAGILEGDTFVAANEKLATIFGYGDPDALEGTPWTELYPQADRESLESDVLARIRDGRGWRGEVDGLRADGSTFSQVLSIQPTEGDRLVWIVRDLQEGTDSEQFLGGGTDRAAEPTGYGQQGLDPAGDRDDGRDGQGGTDRTGPRDVGAIGFEFRLLAEAAPVPIVAITAGRGIVYANREAIELLGGDGRADVLGRDPEQFVHPEHRDQAGERLRRVLEDREATKPTDYRLLGLDEEERFGEVAAGPVTYEGEPGAFVVINDVTPYRRSQARLRRERRFLETAIDTLDDVFYVIDEDWRSYRWNEALVETTGYSDEEIDEMHPMDLLPGDQNEDVPGLIEAIESTEDRRVQIDLLTSDGDRIPHEFKGTTFEDPETGEVFRCGVARDVTERREQGRRLERYETIVETVDDGVYALDEELRFSFVNEGFCEMLGMSHEELLGTPVRDLFTYDDEVGFADEVRRRVLENDTGKGTVRGRYATPDGERIFESSYRLHPEPDGQYRGSVGVVRDVTEREERRRQLEHRLDELATLDRINRILLETTRELVRTPNREVIEGAVTAQLADSDLYQFAWTGEPDPDSDRVVPRSTAGDGRNYLDALATGTGDGVEMEPARRAMETREVQVVTGDRRGGDRWQEAAGERGFESVAAVPLQHEETVYGVLVVQSERPNAFSDREQDGFDVLGRTVGFVVNAVRNHRLLFTEAVVELELRFPDADSVLVDVAAELDCELVLSGHVVGEQRWVLYVDVETVPLDDLVTTVAEHPDVERARAINESDPGGRAEIVIETPSLLHTVSHAGSAVRTATVGPDDVRIVAEAPRDVDVREFVDELRSEHPDAELLGQQDRDREVSTVGRPTGLLERLTDRQREVLEAAFRAGYYAWPRESTATELAESLDLASSTLHGHLRKSEEIILSTMFEG